MSDLDALIERVRGATGPSRELDEAIAKATGVYREYFVRDEYAPGNVQRKKQTPFWATSSLDDAIAICERRAPGNGRRFLQLALVNPIYSAFSIDAIARAMCDELLTALKAQEDGRRG